MTLEAGTKFGPYEIVAPLGAGGMGEVYRARDSRLGRDVAIKILPPQISGDPAGKLRFEREARTVSRLNHPHICVLYDIGSQDGVDYIVMECVEGETLAKRLERGALPLDQVLKFGAQVADALDKAHRSGVVHRDLKPGNVMLTPTGAKLLDFGLAKSAVTQGIGMTLTAEALQSTPVTQAGTIVGTFQYMSPEQIEGKEVDGRSDIFALGAVLYEMLTGKRAFEGKSQLSVASAILEKEPEPINTTKPLTPPALDHAIRLCLAKPPEDRWQTARDLALDLNWIAEGGSQAGAPAVVSSRRARRERIAWATAALAILVAAAIATAAGWMLKSSARPERVLELSVSLPEDTLAGFVELSPDGRRLVLGLSGPSQLQLALRSLDSPQIQPLPGTENARTPFWSPDSRSIGFYANGKLKTVSANGGPVQVLCDASLAGRGGSWNSDGVILFAATTGPLQRVAASGGTCAPLKTPEADENDYYPVFLPDGKHFLYVAEGGEESKRGIYLASLDNPTGQRLLADQSNVVFAHSIHGSEQGYLLFLRGTTLTGERFNTQTLQLTGDAFPVAEQVSKTMSNQVGASASADGTLVYLANFVRDNQLTWFDRSGKALGNVGPHGYQDGVALSPNDKVAAIGRNFSGTDGELWLEDLNRGGATQFTFDPSNGRSSVWSPDGAQIIFSSSAGKLYRKDANGGGHEEPLLTTGDSAYASDWSRDGRFLLYTKIDPKTGADLWVLPDPSGKLGDSKPFPFLQTEFSESQGQFSPDGRWIAYSSNESGQSEVYVRPFSGQPSGSTGKWKVSTDGGREPRWSPNGKELFYLGRDKHGKTELMAVPVGTTGGAVFEAGAPKPLFDFDGIGVVPQTNIFLYSVAADGQRFLVNASVKPITSTLNVIVNWEASIAGNK
jgi:eukaryotic-like serine/threonine-protein kinase